MARADTAAAPPRDWDDSCIDIAAAGTRPQGAVRFEHYDLPETSREGDIHVSGDVKVAWFKDPDGNILSVVNR